LTLHANISYQPWTPNQAALHFEVTFSYPNKNKSNGEPSSSKEGRKHASEDASYDVPQLVQRHQDELSDRFENTTLNHPAHTECPKAILEDLEAVSDFVSDVMAMQCRKCARGLIDNFSAAAWFTK